MTIPLVVFPRFFPHNEPVTTTSVSVIEPSIHHNTDGCARWVTVVGKLANSNDTAVWNPYFEVRFFNEQGELIDSLTSSDSAIVIPAHADASFRVRGQAAREANEYARFEVRVTKVSRGSGY
jgi:hypothetical protein